MWGLIVMWCFIWFYISSRSFEKILDGFGIHHTPKKVEEEKDPIRKWKYLNTRTSLIHATIAGC